jgi:hypothetical protein
VPLLWHPNTFQLLPFTVTLSTTAANIAFDLKTQRITAEAIESQDRMLRDLRRFRGDVDGARQILIEEFGITP